MTRRIAQTCKWFAVAEAHMIVLGSAEGLLAALRRPAVAPGPKPARPQPVASAPTGKGQGRA